MAGRFRGPPRVERAVFDCAWSAFQRRAHVFLAADVRDKMDRGAFRQAGQRLKAIDALGEPTILSSTDQQQAFRLQVDLRDWKVPVKPWGDHRLLMLDVKLNGPFLIRNAPAAGYFHPKTMTLGVTTTIPETVLTAEGVAEAREDIATTVRHEVAHLGQQLLSRDRDVGAPTRHGFRHELDLEYHPWVQDLAFEIRRHVVGLPPRDVRQVGRYLLRQDQWLRMVKASDRGLWRKAVGELGGLIEALATEAGGAAAAAAG